MTRRNWRHFDWLLLAAILVLSIYGIVMIASAVKGDPELVSYPRRQVIYLVVGVILMFAIAALDYHSLGALTPLFYIIVLALLALVGVIGQQIFGAQSWLDFFGLFPIQPSELAKVVTALAMAGYLATREEQMGRFSTVLKSIALILPLLLLVFLEPDLGTAAVIAFEAFIIFLVAGLHFRHMLAGGLVAVALIPAFWNVLTNTQRTRLQIFLDPTADPDSYFNVEQALVSVGSGGVLGKGYGQGTQNQLHFLRVRHTDFIFSVISEEMGFIGAVVVLLLLLFVIMRLWRIADQARDSFGRLLATAVAAIVLIQTLVNVGMNMALVPVTGLPLPFISYGGNAMLSLMLLVGLAQGVAMRKKKIEF